MILNKKKLFLFKCPYRILKNLENPLWYFLFLNTTLSFLQSWWMIALSRGSMLWAFITPDIKWKLYIESIAKLAGKGSTHSITPGSIWLSTIFYLYKSQIITTGLVFLDWSSSILAFLKFRIIYAFL